MGKMCGFTLFLIILLCNVSTAINSYRDLWTFESDINNPTNDGENLSEENHSNHPHTLNIRMPKVSPQKPDTYFCTYLKVPEEDSYIVGFEPHAKMGTAHHMLMFGCDEVDHSGPNKYWNCGEMGGTCSGRINKIIYAWAKDAPPLELPKDVGFHVGGKGRIKYIVLQVHYANVEQFKHHHKTDRSGVTLHLESKRPKYFAGIYLVAAGGPPIPPKRKVFDMDMSCVYTNGPEMHPFAFRVHTHKLGVVVTGYRLRGNKWHLIGKGDPKRAQAFYDVASKKSLRPGDILAARCTYSSLKRDQTTNIGATGADEMCNFYMMYYYDPAEGYSTDSCASLRVPISADEYPADTDTPLASHVKKMDMRRNVENNEHDDLTVEHGWPKEVLSREGNHVGQISGVAANKFGDIVIFHRGNRTWDGNTFDSKDRLNPALIETPIEDDTVWFLKKETGKIFRTWGKGMFHFPHGLSIDQDDNMWFTDVGMHQVFKFSSGGKLLLSLGKKFVPGNDLEHFCKPTDVAIETNGDFFISDGYCNTRVLKFSSKGSFLFMIDQRFLSQTPSFPPPTSFLVSHSTSLNQKENILYVADRENGRVLVFNSKTGKFLDKYAAFGDKVFAISYSKGGMLYVINGQSDTQATIIRGFTFDTTKEKVVQEWRPKKGFIYPHDITTDPTGKFVYVSEITKPGKLWKFKRTKMVT